ncbi:hypothetical protein [Salinisphaera sp. T31B1]|uniref:hypothetical protein n=1 Tax=Salinisphaera sp. T31B1 TaxID=727963 RepID=UPI00333FDCA0
MSRYGWTIALGALLAALAIPALAARSLVVSLIPAQGPEVAVADLRLEDSGAYRLIYRSAPFTPHFLSMRPFECLNAAPRLQCHLPYPYAKGHRVSADDLADLSYDLLFLVKQAGEYGVDFWNGRYYRLSWEGDTIVGQAMAADMNILASRPPAGNDRPLKPVDLIDIAASDTPYPRLRIAPLPKELP